MTIFNAQLTLGNLAGTQWETIDALVDSGATFTVLPRPFLDRIGVRPAGTEPFTLADDREQSAGA